jgi:hypothetical protein
MTVFVKALLLDDYYKLRDESALPLGTHFQFGDFKMGHGFLNEDGSVADIPSSTTELPNVFFTATPTIIYANGRTVVNCLMPEGTIASDTSILFSCVGIYDNASGKLIVILAGSELSLTSIDKLTISSYIDNALNQ